MKKIFLSLLACGLALINFSFIPGHDKAPLPLCTALLKVMKEEPSEFLTLRGGLTSESGTSKSYNSKVVFEGWISTEYSNEDGAISIDVQSGSITKAKAQQLFNSIGKQIAACLGITGAVLQAKGVDDLLIFTKSKCDVALMLITKEGKTFVMISISRES
jgi:hypothetical protein